MQAVRACQWRPWPPCTQRVPLKTRSYATHRRGRLPFAKYQRPLIPRNKLSADFRRKPWAEASDAELEKALAFVARNSHPERKLANVSRLVAYMHDDRAISPTTQHYEALILANTDAQGSVSNVKQLLLQMDAAGLRGSGLIDNAILEVLAVHPDLSMRQKLLQKMAREWTELSPSATHHNIAALIREGQIELAQTEVSTFEATGSAVPIWLYTLLAHSLLHANDVDGLLSLLHRLHDKRIELPRTNLLHLLEACVRHDNFTVAAWLWSKHVDPHFITPSQMCCTRIIELATDHGQLSFADRALLVLHAIEPAAAKQAEATVQRAYAAAGRARPRPQPWRSVHAIFARHAEAFVDPKIVLDTPPSSRFAKPGYLQKKEEVREVLSRRNEAGADPT